MYRYHSAPWGSALLTSSLCKGPLHNASKLETEFQHEESGREEGEHQLAGPKQTTKGIVTKDPWACVMTGTVLSTFNAVFPFFSYNSME